MANQWRVDGLQILDADGFCIAEVHETAILPEWESLGIEHWARAPGRAFIERSEEEALAEAELLGSAPRLKEERDMLLSGFEAFLSRITMVGDQVKTSFRPGELAAARACVAKCRESEHA